MKFFPYDLIAAANEWIEQSPTATRRAVARFNRAVPAYYRHLDTLQGRVGDRAWRFFRHGVEEESLHDARLVEASVGDGQDGARMPRTSRRHPWTSARIEFAARAGWCAVFECHGVRRMRTDLALEQPLGRDLGDLYTYELRSVNREQLALGFVFASGGEIEVEFEKLVFRRARPGDPGRRTSA